MNLYFTELNSSIIGLSVLTCSEKCFRDVIALKDLVSNLNIDGHDKICSAKEDNCEKKAISIDTSKESNEDRNIGMSMILITSAASVGGVLLICVMAICICRYHLRNVMQGDQAACA